MPEINFRSKSYIKKKVKFAKKKIRLAEVQIEQGMKMKHQYEKLLIQALIELEEIKKCVW